MSLPIRPKLPNAKHSHVFQRLKTVRNTVVWIAAVSLPALTTETLRQRFRLDSKIFVELFTIAHNGHATAAMMRPPVGKTAAQLPHHQGSHRTYSSCIRAMPGTQFSRGGGLRLDLPGVCLKTRKKLVESQC